MRLIAFTHSRVGYMVALSVRSALSAQKDRNEPKRNSINSKVTKPKFMAIIFRIWRNTNQTHTHTHTYYL